MTRRLPSVLVLGAAIGVAGCAQVPVVPPVVVPEPPPEGTPAVALLHVSGDPAVAADGLELRLDARLGQLPIPILVRSGERIVAQLGLGQGTYTLGEIHGACALDVDLVAGSETDVLVRQGEAGSCVLAVTGRHEPDTTEHPMFGAVSVTYPAIGAPGDLGLRLRSLDTPPNPVPGAVEDEPDRPGHFFVAGLPQGTYEAQVTGGGAVLGGAEVVVGVGAASEPGITIEPAASPRHTGR